MFSHSATCESEQSFLIRLLGINIDDIIATRLADQGLAITRRAQTAATDDDDGGSPQITFSDGRVFTAKVTHETHGTRWKTEHATYVLDGHPVDISHRWAGRDAPDIVGTAADITRWGATPLHDLAEITADECARLYAADVESLEDLLFCPIHAVCLTLGDRARGQQVHNIARTAAGQALASAADADVTPTPDEDTRCACTS